MKCIDTGDVKKRITELQTYLDANLRRLGADVGWHQHLGTRKVGIVASAIGLLLHKELHSSFEQENDVLSFLVRKQNTDGGWSYISNSQNCSNVEATCWALLALHNYNSNRLYNGNIEKGKAWLLKQNTSIKEDLGWAFRKNGEIRVYITCFVLRTLNILGEKDESCIETALHWLIDAQNKNGGWGETKGDEPSVFFTSYALITLLEFETKGINYHTQIEKGKEWLEKVMNDLSMQESFLICRLEMMETEERNHKYRISFFHYVLPYVVLCYVKLGVCNRKVFESIEILLERSAKGYVDHPMLDNPDKRPIWALYDLASALDCIAPVGEKNKLFVVFLDHAVFLPSNWITKGILKILNKWLLMTVLIAGTVFYAGTYVVALWEVLYSYLLKQVSPNWASACMSIGTSIIATAIIEITLRFRRKIC